MTTNAEKSQASTLFPFTVPLSESGAARMIALPLQQWLRFQAEMLKTGQPIVNNWLERQRQSSEAALKAIDLLSQCRDYAEATSIQSEFLTNQMQRWGSDVQVMAEQIVAISQSGMNAARQAADLPADLAKTPSSAGEQKQRAAKAAE